MTLLFTFSPSEPVKAAIEGLCTRAVQSGKPIVIFERPADLRDMTLQELKSARIGVGLECREATCSVPELMFVFRIYEHMLAAYLADQEGNSTQTPDQISVSPEFTRDDLQHFLNSINTHPARLQDDA